MLAKTISGGTLHILRSGFKLCPWYASMLVLLAAPHNGVAMAEDADQSIPKYLERNPWLFAFFLIYFCAG